MKTRASFVFRRLDVAVPLWYGTPYMGNVAQATHYTLLMAKTGLATLLEWNITRMTNDVLER